MNGLPININLEQLSGAELQQICIGNYQCILNFDKDITISIESDCLFYSSKGEKFTMSNYAKEASVLCSLIGNRISCANRNDDGGLIIKFSNHAILYILNSSYEYESFQLTIHGHLYVA